MADASPAPKPLAARLLRAALGLVLLFGPLVGVELGMRAQVRWLRPVLRNYMVAMDMKLLFLAERDGCPDFVAFGTSLTDHSLVPKYLVDKQIGDHSITDPFDFGLAEARATNILAEYRWLRARGCKPAWIAVEVSPIVINGEHGGRPHDPALLSARAQYGMPDGFAALRGYTVAERLELASYDRLLIHRRRKQIIARALNQLDGEQWFMSAEQKAKAKPTQPMKAPRKLEYDGKITGQTKAPDNKRWAADQRKRRSSYKRGVYLWRVNEPEQQALVTLTREAAADGVGVILHSPPVTQLYHTEMSGKLGITPDWLAFVETVEALANELPGVVWFNAHADDSYQRADFADWVHLSRQGARRYITELLAASNQALADEDPNR